MGFLTRYPPKYKTGDILLLFQMVKVRARLVRWIRVREWEDNYLPTKKTVWLHLSPGMLISRLSHLPTKLGKLNPSKTGGIVRSSRENEFCGQKSPVNSSRANYEEIKPEHHGFRFDPSFLRLPSPFSSLTTLTFFIIVVDDIPFFSHPSPQPRQTRRQK